MKIIFLDFDGVLNSLLYFQSLKAKGYSQERIMNSLEPGMVERLNKIIEATDAKIVISSTWRKLHTMQELKDFLTTYGFRHVDKIVGVTPNLNRDRGYEIEKWMNDVKSELTYENNPITKFVILDDNSDMVYPHLLSNLVLTDWIDGMQDEHAEKAIRILSD